MTARELVASADGVLVDLDGTLVDSSGPVRRAWDGFAARHNLDPDAVNRFAHGRPSRETVRLLAPHADHDVEAALLECAEVADTHGLIALPGALDLLRGDRRLAIVTSCSSALAATRLRAAELPMPNVIVTADDVTHGKPDPTCFQIAARRLGLEPDRCVVLEDAPAGIEAGRAAGATVIALRTTHADDVLGAAHTIIDNLSAIIR